MTPPLTAARPGGPLHRVGRAPDAWSWPPWSYAGEDGRFGNRFDDPAGAYRVLYASPSRDRYRIPCSDSPSSATPRSNT